MNPLVIKLKASVGKMSHPSKLKPSFIIPIFKKGEIAVVENYSPIAIINTLAKIFDSITCDKIAEHFRQNIIAYQNGSMLSKSVLTNLSIIKKIQYKPLLTIMICYQHRFYYSFQ